jgi:hypothetical protein
MYEYFQGYVLWLVGVSDVSGRGFLLVIPDPVRESACWLNQKLFFFEERGGF